MYKVKSDGSVCALTLSLSKLCKDFMNMGGKPYLGVESFIETQAWLRTCD